MCFGAKRSILARARPPSPYSLAVVRLRYTDFTRRPWFEGLELTLEAGEIVVVTGPSGSGKSTLLRTLADLEPADRGRVELDGRDRDSFAPAEWRARVLYLHQTPVRLPGSVRDNVEAVAALAAQRPAAEVSLDLELDQPIEQLSGGEAQRLALDRALALDPDVLLLDEPTSALDGDAARAAEQRVARWVRTGRCALWVAHDAGLPARLGARTVELR